jgi:hypothetical protein
MKSPVECPRETDVLDAVISGRWPEGCDAELHAHTAVCPLCAEVALIAAVLRSDREHAARGAHVPASAQVWWRASMRARAEATRAAMRPITLIQGLAAASTVGVGAALLGSMHVPGWNGWVATASALVHTQTLPLVLVISACVLLAPVAVYLMVSDD